MFPTCVTVTARLTDFEEGHGSWWKRVGVRMHLLYCRNCRRYLAQFHAVRAALKLPPSSAPVRAQTKAVLLQQFHEWKQRPK